MAVTAAASVVGAALIMMVLGIDAALLAGAAEAVVVVGALTVSVGVSFLCCLFR